MLTPKVFSGNKLRTLKYLAFILAGALILFAPITTIKARPLTEAEMNFSKEIEIIFDLQIPGWKRVGNPAARPVFKDDVLEGISADVNFKSGGRTIYIFLTYPNKSNADELIINSFKKIPKEHAKELRIKDCQAILISPPPNQYEPHVIKLSINVANRFVVELVGEEIGDRETLLEVANLIDLKKLAALSK